MVELRFPIRPPRRGLTRTGEDRTMTGRGASEPATTPQGRESPPRGPARAAKRTNRRRRFDGMERMFGKAEDPPSDAVGTPVGCVRSRRQDRRIPRSITRRSMDRSRSRRCGMPGARSPAHDPPYLLPPDGSGRARTVRGFGWMLVEARNCRYAKACQGETDGDRNKMNDGQRVILSGWQGGTSGLHLDAESRRRVFLPLKGVLRRVRLVLPGHAVQPWCTLSPTFWTTCPEFRSADIGKWMEMRGDKPWPLRNPPRYEAALFAGGGETAELHISV